MIKLIYRSRCWIAFALIALLAACNVKSDMDNMERLVMEIENKFERGEDISQDTSIFQARRYFDLSDDAEMKTLSALYSGCVYWQQNDYDSAMKALDEAIATAKASQDLRLLEKVQTTISTLHGDLDHTENMISVFLRRRRMLNIILLALVAAIGVVLFLLYRSAQKRATLAEMKLSMAELQKESENLAETNRDNLFQRTMMIYKVFLIGEKKDIDRETFFYNQVSRTHELNAPTKGDFLIDGKYHIEVGGADKSFKQIKDIPDSYLAIDGVEFGRGNKIPLWLFGFLY